MLSRSCKDIQKSNMIIYKAQNKINGKIYIGVTNKGLDERIYEHWKESKYYFGIALRKYGLQLFDVSIIDSTLLREIANEKEQYWIKFYKSKLPKGYNLTDGGDGIIGLQFTENHRRKISETHRGILKGPHSEETKEKMSISHKGINTWTKGKHHSKETRRKISKGLIGKHHSEETRKKMMGRKVSKETKMKMSEGKKGNKFCLGRRLSEETKRRMSESQKERRKNERQKMPKL